ncbi:MAG: thiolase family protein [Planctomycetes bacterium]|nr:thiolase family protein [Planctomycetota bacterium]
MRIVVVDAIRTPVARAHPQSGAFRKVRADTLAGALISELWRRHGGGSHPPGAVVLGCARQQAEQGFNIARQSLIEGGLPCSVPALAVNRNCSSGLDAILLAAGRLATGQDDAVIAGGVEHMDHLPLEIHEPGKRFLERHGPAAIRMGLCAEHLARTRSISRVRQDAWAHQSHARAARALDEGDYRDETIPCEAHDQAGNPFVLRADDTVRRDSDMARLASLNPVFLAGGTVTAGNASQVNAAAAAVLLMRETDARDAGLKPLARLLSWADAGVSPIEMGMGPVPAATKALAKAGLSVGDIDRWEINEAFAAQVLAVIDELELDESRVNPRGGAIALGHPLGATGARLLVSLSRSIGRGDCRRGVVALCVGGGQGVAAVLESA